MAICCNGTTNGEKSHHGPFKPQCQNSKSPHISFTGPIGIRCLSSLLGLEGLEVSDFQFSKASLGVIEKKKSCTVSQEKE